MIKRRLPRLNPLPGCVLALLLAALLPRPAAATQLSWNIEKFANEFWFIDQASLWDDSGPTEHYRRVLAAHRKLDAATLAALRGYANVRRAHAGNQEPSGPPDVRTPSLNMFPPSPSDRDRFAIAFLTAENEVAACDALKLRGDERAAVLNVFKLLRADIDAFIDDSYLEQARDKLLAAAREARMGEFLDRMQRFYGITDDGLYRVHILFAPEDYGSATMEGHEVLLPLRKSVALDPKELPRWLGVVTHEFGHAYLSRLPRDERAALSNLLINRGGLLNRMHGNVLDEATQTALGNIVFMRDRLPAFFDRHSTFYDWEAGADYPDAIDSLARALEPLVGEALAKGGRFDAAYVRKALDLQAAVVAANAPKLHSHVALLIAGSKRLINLFDNLFWGYSRWSRMLSEAKLFREASAANPGISRWALLLDSEATAQNLDALAIPSGRMPTLPNDAAACAKATRRGTDGGYDFVLLGRDYDGLRRLLIAMHRATMIPESSLCIFAGPKR